MESDQLIDDALLHAEDHIAIGMWDDAAGALEALPPETKRLPHVVLVFLDLMIGQKKWNEGLTQALGLVGARPHDSELWLRIARLKAGAGDLEGAHAAAERCMALNPESRFFLVRSGVLANRSMQHAAHIEKNRVDPTARGSKKVA